MWRKNMGKEVLSEDKTWDRSVIWRKKHGIEVLSEEKNMG